MRQEGTLRARWRLLRLFLEGNNCVLLYGMFFEMCKEVAAHLLSACIFSHACMLLIDSALDGVCVV